ncbi:hypothetical protein [Kitasatospora sp. NBC_01539]|uniref:hypothetical protein n=1 Tax=Kitasatospora sp. NBC_01539 TaxID=2903577 RepID=UPI0038603357
MSRELTPAEYGILAQLRSEIEVILARGTKAELESTTVLSGPGAPPDYTLFHARFQRLGARLDELVKAELVVVNEDLPAAMAANTVVTRGANPTVQHLELRPSLVGPGGRSLTTRAITLVHELSHALFEVSVHPVKDYAYRDGWAWGYLPATLMESNADTFAEAFALLAERTQGRWARYQKQGRVPSQRWALWKAAGVSDLGPALAHADILLNRAWLRSNDSMGVALADYRHSTWATTEPAWRAEPDYALLLRIEAGLQHLGVIGARTAGVLLTGLSSADKATVTAIHTYVTGLKNALAEAEPVPVAAGPTVVYHAATGRLEIPYAVAGVGVVALADLVVDALIQGATAAGPALKAFTDNRRTIIDMLVSSDRPGEKAALGPVRAHFAAAPATAASPAQWAELATELLIATLTDVSGRWAEMATHTEDILAGPVAERAALETIDEYLAKDVETAVAVGKQLPGSEQEFRKMLLALTTIGAAATDPFPARAPHYAELRKRLEPFKPGSR